MALTDEGNGTGMVMPVAPMYGGSGGGDFFGGNGGWWLILFLFAMFGGWGGGFGGGFGGGDLYPWMNQSNQINGGFRDQMLASQVQGIQSGLGDMQLGIAGINQNICQTGNGIVNAINGGFANAETAATARQMADMQQAFSSQISTLQGFNGMQSQLANCCCENRLGIANLGADVAREACADRQAVSEGIMALTAQNNQNTNAIVNTLTNGIQSIKDQLCADKIQSKNDLIAQLRSELMYARGQASQDVQTAAIQAGQRALANEVEQYVAPMPRPAYIVQNPNCCAQNYGCGCGVA